MGSEGQLSESRARASVVVAVGPAAVAVAIALALPSGVAANQDNPHGEIALECSACHTVEGWSPPREDPDFDHGETGFALEQGHADVDCMSCHQSLVFSFVASACVDCHRDPHRGELGFDCAACHRPSDWDNRRSIFDVHGATLFPLTGVHATLDCAACHRPQAPFEYALTPTECFACHAQDYQGTDDPDHIAAGFPVECQFCHDTIDWEDAEFEGGFGFDHSALFQLTGAHATLDCEECHTSGFGGTPSECVGCHLADYQGTQDPNHQQAGIPTTCENCHGTSMWEGAVLDHPFPITGSHQALDCEDCHVNNVFVGTPTECVGCHLADYNGTTDPNHAQAGFSTDCEQCHTTAGWEGAQINHNLFWPLTGAHASLDCEECHANGIYSGTPTDCVACHRADYDATTDPNHAQAGFPTDCEQCHTTSSWEGAEIDHNAFWPLTGAHRNLDCEECHVNGIFEGTPTDCNACHSDDYEATVDPDHQAAAFPRDCELCHNTSSWFGAVFDHLGFPIYTGEHRQGEVWTSCSDCHPNSNNYTIFDCLECHPFAEMQDEHDEVPGFVYESQACLECHPTGEE